MKSNLQSNVADQFGGYDFATAVTGISKNTLYALVFRKRIPHIRLNRRFVRFSRADLITWLDEHKVYPKISKRRV
jgi:excisionase family DNA binding protein